MSSTKLIRQFVTLAVVLTTTGVASARRPPSLVNLEEKTERVLATCPSAPSTSGYRDMLSRFDRARGAAPATVQVARSKMRDHLVLKCAGGEVHESAGYRDMLTRFFHESARPQMAQGYGPR